MSTEMSAKVLEIWTLEKIMRMRVEGSGGEANFIPPHYIPHGALLSSVEFVKCQQTKNKITITWLPCNSISLRTVLVDCAQQQQHSGQCN